MAKVLAKRVSFSSVDKDLKQGATIELTGTSGDADISVDGVAYSAVFNTDLSTTASGFVSTHSADLLEAGISVVAVGETLYFAAVEEGDSFTISIANTTPDLDGTVSISPVITSARDVQNEQIVYVEEQGEYRRLLIDDEGFKLKEFKITDTLASISAAATTLITVTIDGISVGVNSERILGIIDKGSEAGVLYQAEGRSPKTLITAEDSATVSAAIDAL
jgi:hypothetical protein